MQVHQSSDSVPTWIYPAMRMDFQSNLGLYKAPGVTATDHRRQEDTIILACRNQPSLVLVKVVVIHETHIH